MNLVLAISKLLGHDAADSWSATAHPQPGPSRDATLPTSRDGKASRDIARDDEEEGELRKTASRWTEWLRPREIVLDADVRDRNAALEMAAACIGRAHGLESGSILRALLRREQVGSTALGRGVAIPHARIAGLARPLTLFMRTRNPIAFDAPDAKPVSNILVTMVPEDDAADDHLQLLALVAAMFSDRDFRASLSAATNTPQVDEVFAEWRPGV